MIIIMILEETLRLIYKFINITLCVTITILMRMCHILGTPTVPSFPLMTQIVRFAFCVSGLTTPMT